MTDSTLKTTADTTTTVTDTTAGGKTTTASTTDNSGQDKTFDPSKLADDAFEKVFDDPRLFKHSRFQQLNQRAKRAEELEKSIAKADEDKLKEQQKWQELAEKREQEVKDLQAKYTGRTIDNAIQLEAIKAGAVDVEAVLKLIDRTKLTVGDDGTVTGVAEVVANLLKEKTYLTGKPATTKIGDATAPGGADSQAPKKFKASQLTDVAFYRKNEADILKAMKLGLIEDDIPG